MIRMFVFICLIFHGAVFLMFVICVPIGQAPSGDLRIVDVTILSFDPVTSDEMSCVHDAPQA